MGAIAATRCGLKPATGLPRVLRSRLETSSRQVRDFRERSAFDMVRKEDNASRFIAIEASDSIDAAALPRASTLPVEKNT